MGTVMKKTHTKRNIIIISINKFSGPIWAQFSKILYKPKIRPKQR